MKDPHVATKTKPPFRLPPDERISPGFSFVPSSTQGVSGEGGDKGTLIVLAEQPTGDGYTAA